MSLSRRRFLGVTAGISIFGIPTMSSAKQANQANPTIGSQRSDFDAWFGNGTENGEFISYAPVAEGRAAYLVAYDDNGRSETIVGDFNHLPGGGIPFDENEIGQSQFVPTDAVPGPVFNMSVLGGGYGVKSWQSASLATTLNNAGIVVVMDRYVRDYVSGSFKETIISIERPEVHPIVPTGENPGPHSPDAVWQAYPGGLGGTQTGWSIQVPPMPGSGWVSFDRNVTLHPDPALAPTDAANLIASMLPVSDLVWTTFLDITPITNTSMRLHQFRAKDTGVDYLSVQELTGDETTGLISKIDLWRAS